MVEYSPEGASFFGVEGHDDEIIDLKPKIGSEVRADAAVLLSGEAADELRALLVRRGVLVFRDLEFTPEALIEIAKKAKAKDTGARGLRSIVEEIMLEIMYELPDRSAKEKGRFVVTPEVVRKEKNLFDTPPLPLTPAKSASERKKESA